jgi:hypothetical protein
MNWKKLLLIGSAVGILTLIPAQRSDAHVSFAIGIGFPVGFYAYPAYYYPYPYPYCYRPYFYGYYRPYYWYGPRYYHRHYRHYCYWR